MNLIFYFSRIFKNRIVLLFAICVSAACSQQVQDLSTHLVIDQNLNSFPNGLYKEVAWLDESLIAFLYLPPDANDPYNQWEWKIILYDLHQDNWEEISVNHKSACHSSWYSELNRVPDQQLGFIFQCNSNNDSDSTATLYTWDPEAMQFRVRHEYLAPFLAGPYAFSPDTNTIIQERSIGAGLTNQLYWIDSEGKIERLFPDWQRVKEPAWSLDGERIAFVGTEIYAESGGTKTFGDIEALFRYPWTLYVMSEDQSKIELVLPEVADRNLKWFPTGNWISVMGEYKGREGIWSVSLESVEVKQIWPRMEAYDWSPDGKQLILIDTVKTGDSELTTPTIFDLPPNFP